MATLPILHFLCQPLWQRKNQCQNFSILFPAGYLNSARILYLKKVWKDILNNLKSFMLIYLIYILMTFDFTTLLAPPHLLHHGGVMLWRNWGFPEYGDSMKVKKEERRRRLQAFITLTFSTFLPLSSLSLFPHFYRSRHSHFLLNSHLFHTFTLSALSLFVKLSPFPHFCRFQVPISPFSKLSIFHTFAAFMTPMFADLSALSTLSIFLLIAFNTATILIF